VADFLRHGGLENAVPVRLLRELPHRRVEELDVDEAGRFVRKTFAKPTVGRRLAALLRGNAARREWEKLRQARARGVRTPEPLAWAQGAGGHSVLLTRFVEGTDLRTLWEAGADPLVSAVEDFARFVRLTHDLGVMHLDLHPGNVLVTDAAGPDRFVLCDGRSLVTGRPLTRRARLQGLAILNLYFFIRTAPHLRWRFLKTYGEGLYSSRQDLLDAVAEVESLTRRMAGRIWRRKMRRCKGDNRHFARFEKDGVQGVRRRTPLAEGAVAALSDLWKPSGTVVKDSRGALSTVRELPAGRIFVKLFRPRNAWEAFKAAFRPCRAMRGWCMAWAFALRGLPTAHAVLAAGGARRGVSLLCTEDLSDSVALDRFCASTDDPGRAVSRFGQVVADLHDRGVWHRDLKASNVLVGGGEVRICDLDGAGLRRHVSAVRRERDVLRAMRSLREDCGLSPSGAALFVRSYLRRTRCRAMVGLGRLIEAPCD
jgi:tRNA A-37 threonylcarbamoyl transferase component Bud32